MRDSVRAPRTFADGAFGSPTSRLRSSRSSKAPRSSQVFRSSCARGARQSSRARSVRLLTGQTGPSPFNRLSVAHSPSQSLSNPETDADRERRRRTCLPSEGGRRARAAEPSKDRSETTSPVPISITRRVLETFRCRTTAARRSSGATANERSRSGYETATSRHAREIASVIGSDRSIPRSTLGAPARRSLERREGPSAPGPLRTVSATPALS